MSHHCVWTIFYQLVLPWPVRGATQVPSKACRLGPLRSVILVFVWPFPTQIYPARYDLPGTQSSRRQSSGVRKSTRAPSLRTRHQTVEGQIVSINYTFEEKGEPKRNRNRADLKRSFTMFAHQPNASLLGQTDSWFSKGNGNSWVEQYGYWRLPCVADSWDATTRPIRKRDSIWRRQGKWHVNGKGSTEFKQACDLSVL